MATVADTGDTMAPAQCTAKGEKGGRGRGWTAEECKYIVLAWGKTTANAVLGTEKSSASYHAGLYAYYTAANVLYSDRNQAFVVRKLKAIFADVQVFNSCLHEVKGTCPTGVTHEDLLRIACARHVGKGNSASKCSNERNV